MGHSQETILPSVDELNVFEHGRFVLSNIAAKRAKQIKDGAPPLIDMPSIHPLSLALGEIASYKIKSIVKSEEEDKKNILNENITDPSQLGFLLPSLDDLDIQHNLLPDDDIDVKPEMHEMSLEELLLDEDTIEDTIIEQDQINQDDLESISLNELENQENLEDFDEHKDLE